MRVEIRPEATDEERRALVAALDGAAPRRPPAYESEWRRSAAGFEGDERYATAPRRSTAGARRA